MPPRKPSPRGKTTAGGSLVTPLRGKPEAGPRPLPPEAVEEVFARLSAANPQPKAELQFVNPYTLLVAVVLSAQATDKGVNLATAPLFAVADTPEKMVALGEERVRGFIRTIGLFNTKARNVIALSQALIERHGGAVPASRADLEVLPGVGSKTASVVLNVAFGVETIAVDTHIFRVSNRLPLVVASTTDKVQAGLEAIVPARYRLNAHHWLILFGRYVCKARRPECPACLVSDLCRYPAKTI
ncbi:MULTISPECIES: endonuclease III [Methylobacterium]|uniref:endonuclease III n=1 Tax=Methylobacterium TaxID=407 RepID=UPI000CBBFE2E|nr:MULTISPECIES: endonuclease III [Methylobacterium]PIU05643.1 MAG: endonuclease III [Methylobacterium sp. CG09_land_8_20_14_0_10_71_15]PIU12431.1 MAG: endonuclease III [Methylobacterium sp. CG08_land_8_20_14_0_20_71_15]